MARNPENSGSIPRFRRRVQKSGKIYYFYDHGHGDDGKRHEEPLGNDYGLAVKRWAEIERESNRRAQAVITFRYVCDKYRAEIVPTKSPATQRDNLREIVKLIEFFDDPPGPLDAIEPQHVKQYLRWRQEAPVRANREKALFSHIWNWAREQGYTSMPNPCAGVKGHKELGRKAVYIEDDVLTAVWNAADQPLRDAMDLAYLTGQRPADVLKMAISDIRDGNLHVRQGKTGAALRIAIQGDLAALLDRIAKRKHALPLHAMSLIVDEAGHPLSQFALRSRFDRARKKAAIQKEAFQFRDLRAKAGTDKADSAGDVRQAQRQLGHSSVVMTETYIRARRGDKVTPTR
jgi:integrase